MEPEFVVVYDILDEGLSGKRLWIPLAWLAVLLFFGAYAVRSLRRRNWDALGGVGLLLAFWLCAGIFGVGNVVREQWRCMRWARDGEFQVVEGEVRNFQSMSPWGKGDESFTVKGVGFCYSDNNLARGGFNNAAVNGGPMRSGLHVRISYRDGCILKIEARE